MGREEDRGNQRMRRDRPKKKMENADTQTNEQRKHHQEQLVRQEMKSGAKYMADQEKKEKQKGPEQEQPVETPGDEAEASERRERTECPIVGVGASAGGLEALQGLFDHVPNQPPMAFVVVQHRAADHTSVMRALLEKHTRFRVQDTEDGMKVEPGTIYLAPADKDVSLMNGALFLVHPPPAGILRLPIDFFLRSLAQEQAERGIAIILSGTGSDGTLGVKEVKGTGGMIMAQKEDQAKYDSMPRSAIDTGMVDFILPVEKMGEQLAQYLVHPFLALHKTPEMGKKIEDQLQKMFVLIRHGTGQDFSHYKRNTILRRVARRLAVHQIDNLDTYLKLLAANSEEVGILAREMLITVTNFFRDHNAFDALRDRVIRPLVQEKPTHRAIRVWVAGCATGEEAYSIAMLLVEEMGQNEQRHPVQIFGTDLDDSSVEVARHGLYPKSIAADVSPERLQRFFIEENNHYKIKSSIREMIVFARHNLIKDAPFSKLDLVCCRNVLIYMDGTLQQRLLPMFHYTLNPGGVLFLGESESIGTLADLFAPLDARHKIFRRKPAQTGHEVEGGTATYLPAREEKGKLQPQTAARDVSKIAERVILRDYSLPCVLVDRENSIVYFNGDTSAYLIQPGGRPTTDILQMARPEIHHWLSLVLKRAAHEKRMTLEKGIQLRINDQLLNVDIMARPIMEPGMGENLLLVAFKNQLPKENKPVAGGAAPVEPPEQEKDVRLRELEQDLQSTKEYLQTTIEELETSNEELKSANEELQSTNEELQSTNEELDTSREELQSTNEELRTINSEHAQKIDELSRSYDDLNNLLGVEVATVFLDGALRIRRFTPAARKFFRLIERDVGRSIDDISTNLKYDGLLADIRSVLETLTRMEREIPGEGDRWYLMKIVPYRTAENVIDGVVVTFLDISEQKKALAASEESAQFAEAVAETVREPLLILDGDLKVVGANPAFYRHFHTQPKETLGRQVYDLGSHQWDIPALRELLEDIIPENSKFDDFRVTPTFPKIGARTIVLNARQTVHSGKPTGRILLAMEDITGWEADAAGKEAHGRTG